MTEYNLEVGMQVELQPGMDEVYPRALAMSRGVIRKKERDDHGFEKVWIEWDKQHWRYNNEADGWTFASHFRPIRGVDERELVGPEGHEVPRTAPRIPTPEEEERIAGYIDAIGAAFNKAAESDGFFFISLKRDENDHMRLEMMSATTDEDLKLLPSADLLKFAEEEMRRKEEG